MYTPKHFAISDAEEINSFIAKNSFGQLIAIADGKPVSTPMPFLHNAEEGILLGHVAKANPHWKQLEGHEVLVSLLGPHGYISPSWYQSSGTPTWNYQTVHLYGTAHCFSDTEKLKQLVDTLTDFNEKSFESPWQPEYEESKLQGIVGIEIELSDIQCKFKLSQNRNLSEQENVCEHLKSSGANDLASVMDEAMQKVIKKD